jgi:hypothetical protein
MSGSNLPPGVTSAMIEAQVGVEAEAEAICPRGHQAVHVGYPEPRAFVVPICTQRIVSEDLDPPEGVGTMWGIQYHEEGLDRVVPVLGYHLTCEDDEPGEPGGPDQDQVLGGGICGEGWWVAAPLAEVERWEASQAAEQAADEAMERAEARACLAEGLEVTHRGVGNTDQSWWDTYYAVAFPDGATAHVTLENPPPGPGRLFVRSTSNVELGDNHLQVVAARFRVPRDRVRVLPQQRAG